MACNTATAETIDQMRQQFEVPIIGIEPYMRHPQLNPSDQQRKYALILTPATKASSRFQRLQKQNDPEGLIDVFALERFALAVESLKHRTLSEVEHTLAVELAPLSKKTIHMLFWDVRITQLFHNGLRSN
ncbi:MAG: hypothetical protein R3A45_10550 [Bdellovibrionota bacterium]